MNVGRTPDEIENERKRLLIYAFLALGSVCLFVFGTISFVQDRYILGIVLFLFLGIALSTVFSIKSIAKVQPTSLFLASVLFILTSYLLLSGGAEGSGVYWTYPSSVLMVLLVGPKAGSIYMGLYIAVNSVFIFGPFSFVYSYSGVDSIRIMVTTIVLYALILSSEWIRIGSYGAISKTSENHRHLANTDSLTGLLNRNGLTIALEKKRIKQTAIITILDIDKFKHINDNFGHTFGDSVLIKLSKLLKDNTKGGDLAARWGGEEFLLVLFNTSLDSAEALLNKIKDNFEKSTYDHIDTTISATFSAGLAVFNDSSGFEFSVKQADRRLYRAKNSGRNKVVSYDQYIEENSSLLTRSISNS